MKGTLGNFNRRELQGGFSTSVVKDVVAARASFFHDERGGWAENLSTGDHNVGAYNDNAFRGQVLWLINDNWDALANVHFRSYNGQGIPTYHLAANADGLDNYGYSSGFTKANGLRPEYRDPVSQNADGSEPADLGRHVSLKLRGNIGRYELTSSLGIRKAQLRRWDRSRRFARTRSSAPHSIRSTRQTTEELRLASPKEDRLSWIAGGLLFSRRLPCQRDERDVALRIHKSPARSSKIRSRNR